MSSNSELNYCVRWCVSNGVAALQHIRKDVPCNRSEQLRYFVAWSNSQLLRFAILRDAPWNSRRQVIAEMQVNVNQFKHEMMEVLQVSAQNWGALRKNMLPLRW